jgi:hypothetical protein
MMRVEFLGASLTGLIAKASFQRPFHRTIREKVLMPPDASECNFEELRIESSANLRDPRSIRTGNREGIDLQDVERLVRNVVADINYNDRVAAEEESGKDEPACPKNPGPMNVRCGANFIVIAHKRMWSTIFPSPNFGSAYLLL